MLKAIYDEEFNQLKKEAKDLEVYQNTGSSKIIIGASSDNDDLANFGAYRIIGA